MCGHGGTARNQRKSGERTELFCRGRARQENPMEAAYESAVVTSVTERSIMKMRAVTENALRTLVMSTVTEETPIG